MSRARARLEELRGRIPEVSAEQALVLQQQGATLVDIREPDEVAGGSPPGAVRIVRGFLELRIEEAVADPAAPVVLVCGSGVRSLFAAQDLTELGLGDVRSLAGGFKAWKDAGLPVEVPRILGAGERERYGRHLLIPEVGEAGQARLLEARVLLVGAGGLGSPAAMYLAAAGVGTLGIVDDDVVDRSNLQRQILHADDRVGQPKVTSASRTLRGLNPQVDVREHGVRITSANVDEILPQYDVVVDGADNFPTRYLLNDACVKHGRPNVHGSIYRFEGQVSVFHPADRERGGPCYRCLFPTPPPPDLAPSCAEAGVLGVLPGVIGTLQAVETIKLLLGIGEPLIGKLLTYDALRASFLELRIRRSDTCAVCGEGKPFPGYVDYAEFCSGAGR